MSKQTIKEILGGYKKLLHHDITVQGWVRAFRSNRFIALNDGSTINNLQIVVDFENFDENIIKNIKTASSLKITGEVIESEGKGQDIEIIAKKLRFLVIISLKKWKKQFFNQRNIHLKFFVSRRILDSEPIFLGRFSE
jgi:asparaginyl-tRNA synthetase